ncbi:ABC transporter ATP-binding protein [Paenibacillus sp. 1011MAR3C5]|uniref:ABC transporter ATP-binding protein n=1 Tax=Paenibacillus sp. 1011MAR3C5 TaxID=1675787 RepID=UPI000E6C11B8|nr:ABC transporter ATP-binding protein [Paenibacillus sp. 1011MAR3C5]RJE89020.1 ABC transporter ATP-binding protein [Paenibacillus sp. 1011MAR3C5]
MKTVFSYLKRYRAAAIVALTLMLTELLVELFQPYIMAKMIDEGIQMRDTEVIFLWGGILLLCSIVAFGVGILSSFYAAHVSQSFGYDLREKLYEKIQSFSFANYNSFPESSLITRLTNDIIQLQNTVFMGLRIMLRAPLFIVGSVIMAFVVNWKLALWFAGAIPFLTVFLYLVMKRGEKLFRSVQQKLDRVNAIMQQNLIGMRLIRVFVRMKHERGRFDKSSGELMDRTVAALRLTEMTMPIILLVMNAGIIAVLWFGRVQLEAGSATVGEIVAIVNYATRTVGVFSLISMIVVNFSKAKASSERIEEVLVTNATLADGDAAPSRSGIKGGISFQNVTFRYPDTEEPILSGISFRAAPGETLAIMGATGSGKTTLLQLIPRFYDTAEGAVSIDGQDHVGMKMENLRRSIGYVPQDIVLFSGTVADNIRVGKDDASMDEIMEAAKLAQIHETIMRFPRQYDTVIGQMGVNLSGGQKQRLTIARALVRKPAILLLDDCTSALDVRTEAALLEALKAMNCTTLLVTQKVSSTANADRILLLDDGRLLASGTHEQMKRESALYMKICQSQSGKAGAAHA